MIDPSKYALIEKLSAEGRSINKISKIVHSGRKQVKAYLEEKGLFTVNERYVSKSLEETATHKICSACPEKGLQPLVLFRKKESGKYFHKCTPCQNKYLLEGNHERNPDMKYDMDEQVLQNLVKGGMTDLNDLAKEVDRSIEGVRKALKRLDLFEGIRKKKAKIEIDPAIAAKVQNTFDGKKGARAIANELGLKREEVYKYYEYLDIDNSDIKVPTKELPTTKICRDCPENGPQPIDNFKERIREKPNGGTYITYEAACLPCSRKERNERGKAVAKKKRKEDPIFKMHKSASYAIWKQLKSVGKSKEGHSCLDFLPYDIEDLVAHIEDKFEYWMTWENHGVYIPKEWDDNDPSTWKWQLDHIIPHSKFNYASMNCEEFRQCWALSNLQPLSAKQNNQDGVRRTRH